MKRTICTVLALTLSFTSVTYAAETHYAEKKCMITDLSSGQQIQGDCGFVVDDRGNRQAYRRFVDPRNGDIVEHRADKNMNFRILRYGKKSEPSRPESTTSKVNKWVVIGGAVVAVVGTLVGVRMIKNSHARAREEAVKLEAVRKMYQAHQSTMPSELAGMPTSLKLGAEIPQLGGKTVRVAGAVPTSEVDASLPRFRNGDGQTYVLVRRPTPQQQQSSSVEALLLYDYLYHPWYPFGFHAYDTGSLSSPYTRSADESVVVTPQSGGADTSIVAVPPSRDYGSDFDSLKVEETAHKVAIDETSGLTVISDSVVGSEAETGYVNSGEDKGWMASATDDDTNKYAPVDNSSSNGSYTSDNNNSDYSSSSDTGSSFSND